MRQVQSKVSRFSTYILVLIYDVSSDFRHLLSNLLVINGAFYVIYFIQMSRSLVYGVC